MKTGQKNTVAVEEMEKIVRALLRQITIASNSAAFILADGGKLVCASLVEKVWFDPETFSLEYLMGCASPRTRRMFGRERELWTAFVESFPNLDLYRCYFSINLEFIVGGHQRIVHFTFKRMDDGVYVVFMDSGGQWQSPFVPFIIDAANRDVYTYSDSHWHLADWSLSSNEKRVIDASAKGLTARQIADQMCLSLDAVNYYKRNIFSKLNVKNMSEATHAFMSMTSAPMERH